MSCSINGYKIGDLIKFRKLRCDIEPLRGTLRQTKHDNTCTWSLDNNKINDKIGHLTYTMRSYKIIPENVARVLPASVTAFFNSNAMLPKNKNISRSPRRKFDFRNPNRAPIYMPGFIALCLFILLCYILYSRMKNHVNLQVDGGGLCNSSVFLSKKNILFLLVSAEDMVLLYPTLSALASTKKYIIHSVIITGMYRPSFCPVANCY